MSRLNLHALIALALYAATLNAQPGEVLKGRGPFTHNDSLRGSLNPARTCYDVRFYDLSLRVNPDSQSISGSNTITYTIVADFQTLQLELKDVYSVRVFDADHRPLPFTRDGIALLVHYPGVQRKGSTGKLIIEYAGKPPVAPNPPWGDAGFVWEHDSRGKHWVGVACEGEGASTWWPCKDHPGDEPDSMRIRIACPNGLMDVSNGVLRRVTPQPDGYTAYEWFVSNPINLYDVTLNIGDYAQITSSYTSKAGPLALNYYVLREEVDQAKTYFAEEVPPMLEAFEYYFGPYPFRQDGYALVQTHYWGMEHQSAIAYGNHYRRDHGFDFIIVHESAHEWWGNNVSADDHGDMWIHESFADYAEALYVERRFGAAKAQAYLNMQRAKISNIDAIQGPHGVAFDAWPNADMYYKGTWILHTLRNCLQNDSLWFKALRELNRKFYHKTTNTGEVVNCISKVTHHSWHSFFDQYLNYSQPPQLVYSIKPRDTGYEVAYRWSAQAKDFSMPIVVFTGNGDSTRLIATRKSKILLVKKGKTLDFKVDTTHYYCTLKQEESPS